MPIRGSTDTCTGILVPVRVPNRPGMLGARSHIKCMVVTHNRRVTHRYSALSAERQRAGMRSVPVERCPVYLKHPIFGT